MLKSRSFSALSVTLEAILMGVGVISDDRLMFTVGVMMAISSLARNRSVDCENLRTGELVALAIIGGGIIMVGAVLMPVALAGSGAITPCLTVSMMSAMAAAVFALTEISHRHPPRGGRSG